MLLTIENLEIVKCGKQLIHNFNDSFDKEIFVLTTLLSIFLIKNLRVVPK